MAALREIILGSRLYLVQMFELNVLQAFVALDKCNGQLVLVLCFGSSATLRF